MGLAAVDLGQRPVHVQKAGPADQPLDRDPVIAFAQDAQDLVLDRIAGGETGVAALGRHGDLSAVDVARQGRDAEAGAGPSTAMAECGSPASGPPSERQVGRRHDGRAPGQGLEIVDQPHGVQAQGLQLGLRHAPRASWSGRSRRRSTGPATAMTPPVGLTSQPSMKAVDPLRGRSDTVRPGSSRGGPARSGRRPCGRWRSGRWCRRRRRRGGCRVSHASTARFCTLGSATSRISGCCCDGSATKQTEAPRSAEDTT